MHDRIILMTFNYRHEAEFFQSLLEAHEIESLVVSDDCGAMDPGLGYVNGVHLYIAPKDREQAERLITATEPGKDDYGE